MSADKGPHTANSAQRGREGAVTGAHRKALGRRQPIAFSNIKTARRRLSQSQLTTLSQRFIPAAAEAIIPAEKPPAAVAATRTQPHQVNIRAPRGSVKEKGPTFGPLFIFVPLVLELRKRGALDLERHEAIHGLPPSRRPPHHRTARPAAALKELNWSRRRSQRGARAR